MRRLLSTRGLPGQLLSRHGRVKYFGEWAELKFADPNLLLANEGLAFVREVDCLQRKSKRP